MMNIMDYLTNHPRWTMMDFSLLLLAGMLVLGGFLGLMGGLFGIGGGILAIPVLALAFHMEQQQAQGTALVMMVPNLLIAFWRYQQRHPISLSIALQLGGLAACTTWATAQVANQLNSMTLRILFGLFMLWLALRLMNKLLRHSQKPPQENGRKPLPQRYLPLVGLVGGTSSGLLGIGGGLIANPFFTGWFGQRQTTAQSLSLALVLPASLVALTVYAGAGQVNWPLGLLLAVGGLGTVSAGVALAHRWPERRLQSAFAGLMLITALWMILGPLLKL